jgi:hypothetical protein
LETIPIDKVGNMLLETCVFSSEMKGGDTKLHWINYQKSQAAAYSHSPISIRADVSGKFPLSDWQRMKMPAICEDQ